MLATALKGNDTLTSLNLHDNDIGDEGAKALATAMKENENIKLTSLNLRANNIGDEGARAIATAMKENEKIKLTRLNLGLNAIGDEGAKALAMALLENDTLTFLDLSQWFTSASSGNYSNETIEIFQSLPRFKSGELQIYF